MRAPITWLKLLMMATIILCSAAQQAATLKLTTEESPPYNMQSGDKVVGIGTDKIREMMHRAKVDISLELFPWKRAYTMALTNAETCVFSTTRTPEREALFKWVGPLGSADWILYAATDRNLKLSTLNDASSLLIGTYGGDVRDDFFRSKGYRVESVADDSLNPKKLLLHRIDLWAASRTKAALFISQNGWADKITPVLTFHKVDLYLACNLGVPDALILQLNSTLEAMNKDGTSNAIEKKYAN